MNSLDLTYFLWAVSLGGLSAASLPLGSAVGLIVTPRPKITAMMAAFGAGALIAALSVELVAPTVAALGETESHGETVTNFLGLVIGAIVGGVLFVVLDQLVNAHGGFLRKSASTIAYLTARRKKRTKQMLQELCTVSLLRKLPPEQVGLLVNDVRPEAFSDGEALFQEGDRGDRLFFIRSGRIELYQGGDLFKTLESGGVLGEVALLTGVPRTVSAKAKGSASVLALGRNDFERWRKACPELDRALKELASQRLEQLNKHKEQQREEATEWATKAIAALKQGAEIPTAAELRQAQAEHSGAPLAVWLGILLDGIPESFVIGSGFLALLSMKLAASPEVAFADIIPYTLLAGLFLSNFPEAMSSSIGMKMQGWSAKRTLFMWTTLMIMTALGAGVGYALGEALPHSFLVAIEGVAAGAMLTMIASTMIPEAVHLGGGNIVGMSTLVGFLSAIVFKLFE